MRAVRFFFAAFMVLGGIKCVVRNVKFVEASYRWRKGPDVGDLYPLTLGIVCGLAFAGLGLLLFWRTASSESPSSPRA